MINVLFALLFLSVALPLGGFYLGERKTKRFKNALVFNLLSFFVILLFTTAFLFSGKAFAADEVVNSAAGAAGAAGATGAAGDAGMAYLAAALVTGLCTIGTGIATGQAAAAALGALSENEKIMGKALIFVALCEGIAIYGLLISFTILGRV
ncbi:MAG: ATP synthase subunit C [Clostridiales bacterium]|jgi:V/A-type H+-transporting ATPase subunit K|nr:ATP synthase subunit C [Clostridiales bacterium]